MNNFFRKLNRGALLSIAIILVIIGYYVVIGIKTAPEKKLMYETFNGYFGVFSQYAVLTEQEYKDLPADEATLDKRIGEFADAARQYFTDGKTSENARAAVQQMLNNQIVYRDTEYRDFRCETNITKCRVDFKKNTASVKLTVTMYYIAEHTDNRYDDEGQVIGTDHWTDDCSFFGDSETWSVTMTKTGDRWLIDDISRSYNYFF